MKNVITIGRQLGSGGRTIGKKLAERLGIPYYDRELIDEVAKQSGFSTEFIEKSDEKMSSNFLYNLAMSSSYFYDMLTLTPTDTTPLTTQVFLAQQQVIMEYAKEPCVIVGRCADYILRDRDDVLSVYLYADMDKRIHRAIKHYKGANTLDEKKAIELINKSDKARARHYSAFTDWEWGEKDHYDLMINTTTTGLEGATKIIIDAYKADPLEK